MYFNKNIWVSTNRIDLTVNSNNSIEINFSKVGDHKYEIDGGDIIDMVSFVELYSSMVPISRNDKVFIIDVVNRMLPGMLPEMLPGMLPGITPP